MGSLDRFALMFKQLSQNPEFNRQFGTLESPEKRFASPNNVWSILTDLESSEDMNYWVQINDLFAVNIKIKLLLHDYYNTTARGPRIQTGVVFQKFLVKNDVKYQICHQN